MKETTNRNIEAMRAGLSPADDLTVEEMEILRFEAITWAYYTGYQRGAARETLIPDKCTLTVGDVLSLYQLREEGGANGDTFFNTITAAYKMGFGRGQRAAGKAKE